MKKLLLEDLKEAMRNKDELKKDTITMLRAAILQVEKDEQKELTQQDIDMIVAKEVKKRKDSIQDYIKGNRQDIVTNIEREIEILSKYLPKQLSIEEIKTLVDEAILNTGAATARDMGKVMQYLRPKTSGKADGKVISDLVKGKLSQ